MHIRLSVIWVHPVPSRGLNNSSVRIISLSHVSVPEYNIRGCGIDESNNNFPFYSRCSENCCSISEGFSFVCQIYDYEFYNHMEQMNTVFCAYTNEYTDAYISLPCARKADVSLMPINSTTEY